MGDRFINAENKVIFINMKEALYCEIIFHPEKKSLLKDYFKNLNIRRIIIREKFIELRRNLLKNFKN